MKNIVNQKCLVILTDMKMGGVTTSAVNFCNGLCDRGAHVDILLMSDCDNLSDYALSDKIGIFRLNGIPKLWNLGPNTIRTTKNVLKKFAYLLFACVKKVVNKRKLWTKLVFRNKNFFKGYDVAIAYRQCQPCYYFALHNVEAKRKAAFVHGDLAFMGDVSTWQPLMCHFDAIAYVSNAVKDGFIRRFPELSQNAVTVYNTFLTNEIIRKSKLESDIVFDRSKLNLITVSRIENTMKGTERIALVCKLLKEKYPNTFRWYVVGDGPDYSKCVNQAEELCVTDHLTYLGARSNPFNLLAQADACVLPSFTEAFPMVAVESLIVGIPVVATRYPAVAESFKDRENGIVAEQSVESLFEKIAGLFNDRDLLARMKENSMSYQYDNDRSYRQLFAAINL